MKRALKRLGLGFVGLVVVLTVVGLFLPRQWKVERSIVINASPEHIHPLVDDLKAWQSWAAWTKDMDPEVKNEYGGPASGVGAWWAWEGPKMGLGKMTITKSDVAAGVWIDEMIETREAVNAHGSLTWTQEGGGTKVTWVDSGTLPPIMGGYFVGMINTMLGNNFQQGLKHLKAEVEKRRAAEQEAAQAAQPVPAEAAPAVQAAPAVP
ncbi:SRPBCC family protein [Archangium gephyra]|uniref:SRPBCC family protein n=1 Tax=Archangium gephyra TaxID=48 RepID=UPI003B82B904